MPFEQQAIAQVRADKPSGPGNNDSQKCSSGFRISSPV
jgi:hypothetical protein